MISLPLIALFLLPAPPQLAAEPVTPGMVASRAYGRIVTAFNKQDTKAYLAGYANKLTCFYGAKNMSHKAFAKERLKSVSKDGDVWPVYVAKPTLNDVSSLLVWQTEIVSESAKQVALIDYGRSTNPDGLPMPHAKYIVMAPDAKARWQVVAEFGASNAKCPLRKLFLGKDKKPRKAPKRIAACRDAYAKAAKGTPSVSSCKKRGFGSNSCQDLLTTLNVALNHCWTQGTWKRPDGY